MPHAGTSLSLWGQSYTIQGNETALQFGILSVDLCLAYDCRYIALDVPTGGVSDPSWNLKLDAATEQASRAPVYPCPPSPLHPSFPATASLALLAGESRCRR